MGVIVAASGPLAIRLWRPWEGTQAIMEHLCKPEIAAWFFTDQRGPLTLAQSLALSQYFAYVVEAHGEPVGIFLATDLHEPLVEVHAAFWKPGWATPAAWLMASYARTHGVTHVHGRIYASNRRARRFFEGLGARLLAETDSEFTLNGRPVRLANYLWRIDHVRRRNAGRAVAPGEAGR